jgi:hypothetical protein
MLHSNSRLAALFLRDQEELAQKVSFFDRPKMGVKNRVFIWTCYNFVKNGSSRTLLEVYKAHSVYCSTESPLVHAKFSSMIEIEFRNHQSEDTKNAHPPRVLCNQIEAGHGSSMQQVSVEDSYESHTCLLD